MGSFCYPKSRRLLNRIDFVNLNRSGRRHHTSHFVLIFKHNGLGISRLGVTASKRTGNAVKRNRVKRLIREYFRLNQPHFFRGYDIVIASKKDAGNLDFWKVKEELDEVISNGILDS